MLTKWNKSYWSCANDPMLRGSAGCNQQRFVWVTGSEPRCRRCGDGSKTPAALPFHISLALVCGGIRLSRLNYFHSPFLSHRHSLAAELTVRDTNWGVSHICLIKTQLVQLQPSLYTEGGWRPAPRCSRLPLICRFIPACMWCYMCYMWRGSCEDPTCSKSQVLIIPPLNIGVVQQWRCCALPSAAFTAVVICICFDNVFHYVP